MKKQIKIIVAIIFVEVVSVSDKIVAGYFLWKQNSF